MRGWMSWSARLMLSCGGATGLGAGQSSHPRFVQVQARVMAIMRHASLTPSHDVVLVQAKVYLSSGPLPFPAPFPLDSNDFTFAISSYFSFVALKEVDMIWSVLTSRSVEFPFT
ncbi:hypothetical protein Nepgr_027581 [Nepenthes gracilis]|uniref:Secreted protein n=1 Tax=Nepenthes gracilis TaxID=150966 RepID=A0AAD3Y1J9_NEPGR|nr:hypothetical protein Nepgr_027581 [Nepenthes gracilis]